MLASRISAVFQYPLGARRALLPIIRLPRSRLDKVGKTTALLWQLLLITGKRLLRVICVRVRGILTDNGVERSMMHGSA